MSRFTWQVTAAGTAACYEAVIAGKPLPGAPLAAVDGLRRRRWPEERPDADR